MQVSIITSLFNRLDLTRVFLESLERTLRGWRYEVILIDDGSTDGTRDFLRGLSPKRYRVALNDSPRGFAANNNTGARLARAPLLCLLNNDVVLTRDWLRPMTRLARWIPDIACVGNVQREPVSGLIDHHGIYFDAEQRAMHAGKNTFVPPDEPYLRWPAVTAACWVIRKCFFLGLGGFDETFRNGFEDMDFCLRAGARGYRHFVANRSVIYHHVSASPLRKQHEDDNLRVFRERWSEFIKRESGSRRTRRDARREGQRGLRELLHRPWRFDPWRFSRALEQSRTSRAPQRRLEFLPRVVFRLQDLVGRHASPQSNAEMPSANAPVFMLVDDTARNSSCAGIPTLVRSLAGAFGRLRAPVRLVIWNSDDQCLRLLPPELSVGADAEALRTPPLADSCEDPSAPSLYSPMAAAWHEPPDTSPAFHDLSAATAPPGAWVLVPELMYRQRAAQVAEYVRRHGWRLAVIFHDASPTNEPQFFSPEIPNEHDIYLRAISAADKILPVSEFAAHDWKLFVGAKHLPQPTVEICKPGADTCGPTRGSEPKVSGPAEPVRILCVSSIAPRKGHQALLAAYDLVVNARPDLQVELSLVGEYRPGADQIAGLINEAIAKYHGKVAWHEWVEYSTLRRHYEACDFTVYPSTLEGLGLPILESLWFGRPCLCANFGGMDETSYGGGCLRVDVRDPAVLTAAMLSLIETPDLRRSLAVEATTRHLPTWNDYANELLRHLPAPNEPSFLTKPSTVQE